MAGKVGRGNAEASCGAKLPPERQGVSNVRAIGWAGLTAGYDGSQRPTSPRISAGGQFAGKSNARSVRTNTAMVAKAADQTNEGLSLFASQLSTSTAQHKSLFPTPAPPAHGAACLPDATHEQRVAGAGSPAVGRIWFVRPEQALTRLASWTRKRASRPSNKHLVVLA